MVKSIKSVIKRVRCQSIGSKLVGIGICLCYKNTIL